MFQKHEIVGPHIWQYIPGPVELSSTRYRSKMYDRIFKKIYFKFCTRVRHAQISLKSSKWAIIDNFVIFCNSEVPLRLHSFN